MGRLDPPLQGTASGGSSLIARPSARIALSMAGFAAMRIIGVDHTGPEPVLVIDFGTARNAGRWTR